MENVFRKIRLVGIVAACFYHGPSMASVVTKETVPCACCGCLSDQSCVQSTSFHGCVDLDTRPPYPARGSLLFGVQYCTNCHYCATSLASSLTDERALRLAREKVDVSDPCARFERAAKLALIERKMSSEAAFLVLGAAWLCDDRHDSRAESFRRTAYGLFTDLSKVESRWEYALIRVDVLRRIADYENASKLARELLDGQLSTNRFFRANLLYEIELIAKKDRLAHSVRMLKRGTVEK